MKITQERLDEIIASHGRWLKDPAAGQRADLREADLQGADLREADLRGANLQRADLREADLQGADLQRADLQRADLQRADLQGAYLQGADLQGADLQGAYLQGADLREADLRGADLWEADLREADLQRADLRGAYLPKGIYQVVGPGSARRCTTYDSINDQIVCGCWSNPDGNTLAAFRERIESVYGQNGTSPNAKYYAQYQATIAFFEAMVAAEEK